MDYVIRKAIEGCYRYGTIDFDLCAKDTCPLYEDCNNLYYGRLNDTPSFYEEIVNKTKMANDPQMLAEQLYTAIKIRIEDAAEEGLDNCYVEPNWKYGASCFDDCIHRFSQEGFTCILNHNHGGYTIRWEGGTDAYEEKV